MPAVNINLTTMKPTLGNLDTKEQIYKEICYQFIQMSITKYTMMEVFQQMNYIHYTKIERTRGGV